MSLGSRQFIVVLTILLLGRVSFAEKLMEDDTKVWIEGVPSLSWKTSGQTTFCGALSAASQGTDRHFDYDTLMAATALAYRVRWYEGPEKGDRWVGGIPVGEQDEERKLAGAAIGVTFESSWADGAAKKPVIAKAIESIDAGRPVITYIAPHMDCAVLYGYSRDRKTLLLKDYYAPNGPDAVSTDKVGPWFLIYHPSGHAPLSADELLKASFNAAIHNWSRADRPQWGFPGHFLYGKDAWDRWIADMKKADALSAKDKQQLCFVNWWNYDSIADARASAARFLKQSATTSRSPALASVADAYEQSSSALAKGLNSYNLDSKPPWTAEFVTKWTVEARAQQIEILEEARDLDTKAIAAMEDALAALP